MNITIEAQVLNHQRRSGLMTYTEGLVDGICRNDGENDYTFLYYSLKRRAEQMPGPTGPRLKKNVLRVPEREFRARQWFIDHIALPAFFKKNRVNVFHRPNGYTIPPVKDIFKILTIHDLRTLTIGDKVWGQNIESYKKSIAQVDLCVVVSECTRRDVIQYLKVDERKVKVVYLGAEERFKPASQERIQELKMKYKLDRPFLLSIGSVPRKNIDGIIRGFAASKFSKEFLLVLSCNQDVKKYQALAHKERVGSQVMILDNLTDDEVVAMYSSCVCFLFPSLYEGFGLPILEAMQCGAPVITANNSSCPEVAGDAAILINPNAVEEIEEAINQICGNQALRKDLIAKGFEQAKKFSWQVFAQEMKKIYSTASKI